MVDDAAPVGVLELSVDLPAEPEVVWAAFTSTEGLRRWWWNHWHDVELETDARVGGRYRFAAPAAGIAVAGEHLVVEAPTRLAFGWEWTDADGTTEGEVVELRFDAAPTGTRLSLRQTGPWIDATPGDDYREGWAFTLGALAESRRRRAGSTQR